MTLHWVPRITLYHRGLYVVANNVCRQTSARGAEAETACDKAQRHTITIYYYYYYLVRKIRTGKINTTNYRPREPIAAEHNVYTHSRCQIYLIISVTVIES